MPGNVVEDVVAVAVLCVGTITAITLSIMTMRATVRSVGAFLKFFLFFLLCQFIYAAVPESARNIVTTTAQWSGSCVLNATRAVFTSSSTSAEEKFQTSTHLLAWGMETSKQWLWQHATAAWQRVW
jgi:hypothetical protein